MEANKKQGRSLAQESRATIVDVESRSSSLTSKVFALNTTLALCRQIAGLFWLQKVALNERRKE